MTELHTNVFWADLQRYKALIEKSVDIYCTFLNQFIEDIEDNDEIPVYHKGVFLDKDQNPYSHTTIRFLHEEEGRLYMQLSVYDGEDGGPANLYVYADRDWHYEKTGRTIKATREEYEILEYRKGGPNVVADKPTTVPFEYEEQNHVWDDTYTIKAIIQEFDTMFTPVFFPEGTDADRVLREE